MEVRAQIGCFPFRPTAKIGKLLHVGTSSMRSARKRLTGMTLAHPHPASCPSPSPCPASSLLPTAALIHMPQPLAPLPSSQRVQNPGTWMAYFNVKRAHPNAVVNLDDSSNDSGDKIAAPQPVDSSDDSSEQARDDSSDDSSGAEDIGHAGAASSKSHAASSSIVRAVSFRAPAAKPMPLTTVVINLERRPDRRAHMERKLQGAHHNPKRYCNP